MKKGGGHRKGAEFERVVAKLIVKAFRKFGIKQRECWRSVMSGGHTMSSGDLTMSDRLERLFPFVPEMKCYKEIHWERFLFTYGIKSSWRERRWLHQAESGASKRARLRPILVLKKSSGPIYVFVPAFDQEGSDGVGIGEFRWDFMLFSRFLENQVERAERLYSRQKIA